MSTAAAPEKISVVIPTVNEELTLADVMEGCRPHCGEIIVVDGHSTDRTREIAAARGAKVILDGGKGKGEALRRSAEHVTKEIIVFIDADGSHNPFDIPRLTEPILDDRTDHVTGSRLIGGSSELHGGFDEFMRLAGSSFITALINWKFDVRLSDSQNGFRAIRADVFRALKCRENIFTIEMEIIMKALKKGYRVSEVPTHENRRVAGYSKISIRKVWLRYGYVLMRDIFLG